MSTHSGKPSGKGTILTYIPPHESKKGERQFYGLVVIEKDNGERISLLTTDPYPTRRRYQYWAKDGILLYLRLLREEIVNAEEPSEVQPADVLPREEG